MDKNRGPHCRDSQKPAFFWQFLQNLGCAEKNPVSPPIASERASCCSFPPSLSGLFWGKSFPRSIPVRCRQHRRHTPSSALSSPVENRPLSATPAIRWPGNWPCRPPEPWRRRSAPLTLVTIFYQLYYLRSLFYCKFHSPVCQQNSRIPIT